MDILLDIANLHLNFGALRVTDDVSLRLHKGSRTALIGPNGAGKTTLVNLIAGTLAPQSGTITLRGEDVTNLKDIQRVKRGLVRSFQVTRLFPGMSALDHLAIAILQREGKSGGMFRSYQSMPLVVEEALEVLAMLRLEDLATRKVAQIAYGQQRLLEIAIALVLKPKILLLDEPAAGIPSSDTERVLAALETLPADLAVLLIDHDMDLVRRFAREVVVLSAGAVIFAGTPDRIGSDPRVRSAYLGDETL